MLWILAALAAQASGSVSLSTVTGGMIAAECAKSAGLILDTCASYVLGVADTLQIEGKTCHGSSDAWTIQTLTIVRRYIDAHPEEWDSAPAFLIREALVNAFPCR